MKTWRDSIKVKPKVLIQRESTWKQSIRPIIRHGNPGKDFDFNEHKDQIEKLISRHINSIKEQLKGESVKGDKGGDGSRWFFFEEVDDSKGKNGDFCLSKDGDVYEKISNEWEKRNSLKGKDAKSQYIGGGVTESRVNELIASGGGGTATNIVSTAINLTVISETHVIVTGIVARTISLKSIATATEPVKVINKSTQNVTVNISGGGLISDVVDDSAFIIVPGNSFTFLPDGTKYHVT